MATEWRQTETGFEAIIDLEDGSQPQVFRGKTEREVADKLLDAQTHASRRIAQLRAEQRPDPEPVPQVAAKPLTAGERMQLAHDITDPAKSDAAIERILAAKGIPVSEIQQVLSERHLEIERANAIAETTKFVESTPAWHPSDHNRLTLANYMRANKMGFTARNFSIAFDALQEAGLLQPKPEETPHAAQPEPQPEQRIVASTTRPRTTMSTGIRAGEGRTAAPSSPRPKYTKRDIERMPTEEYRRKLESEPGFSQAVDLALAR